MIEGDQDVPECHLDLLWELAKPTSGAIIFPRGHAKSTWAAIDMIHDLVYGLEPLMLYVGNTLADGKAHLDGIKRELENNELLIDVYDNLVPADSQKELKWTDKYFETTNGCVLAARGAVKGRGLKFKGKRPSKIVLDDIEHDQGVQQDKQRKKLHNWVQGVIMQMLARKIGRVKMLGTVLHPKSELIQFFNTYGGIFRGAIENGVPIWWSMDELKAKEKEMGSLLFRQEYMNEPITESERLIKEAWLRRVAHPLLKGPDGSPLMDMFGAMDPAASKKETADYTADCTVGRNRDTGILTVMAASRDHMGINDQIRQAFHLHRTWKYQTFGVEVVGYQAVLEAEISRLGAIEGIYVPAVPITRNKDKVLRLIPILPFIENGTIQFCDDLPEEFFNEILSFPNGENDDFVDALIDACTLALNGAPDLTIQVL